MNILILTTIYKDPEDSKDAASTPIVYNFAKEWVKEENRVLVIHNFNTFLYPLYYVPEGVKKIISNKLGFRTSLNVNQRKEKHYTEAGVEVYRVPILKVVPRGAYLNIQLRKQLKKIKEILKKENFVPDVILGHAENPQIYQIYFLKQEFFNAKTGVVFHGIEYLQRKQFQKWRDKYLPSINKYGFRSEAIHKLAQEKIHFSEKYFLCPSGISDEYVTQPLECREKVTRFLYVGQLIKRKHVQAILEAFCMTDSRKLQLDIIGQGAEEESLKEYVKENNMKNVSFKGFMAHKDVMEQMKKADCFVMISEQEVFGLVYLEAMSQGCITIASEGEGMQGIIRNEENGYLCSAGDVGQLSRIIEKVMNLDTTRLNEIRKKSYETAAEFSESKVARKYLDEILKL